MLKTILLPKNSTFHRLEINDGEDSISVSSDDIEHAKKLGKLKAQKLPKSQKLSKS